jgi:hypothetical protein
MHITRDEARPNPQDPLTHFTFKFRTREGSILASLWSWISLVSSYPSITTKFARLARSRWLQVALGLFESDACESRLRFTRRRAT